MFKKLSLRTKIILAIIIVVVPIVSINSYLVIQYRKKELESRISSKAKYLSKIQSQNVSSAMWDVNEDSVRSGISAVLEDREIFKVEVYDEDNEIFSSVAKATNIIEESFFAEHDIIHYDEDNTEGIKIGSIKIFFTRYYLNSSLNDDLLRFLMSGFVLISFLIIFMVFLITRFTSPLITLTGIMKERLSGNYESQVNKVFAKREDEIGQISKIMIKESVLRTNEKQRVKFVEKLTSGWALDRLLNELIFDFKNIMNCERVSIFVYNREENILVSKFAIGIGSNVIKIPITKGVVGKVFTEAQSIIINNPQDSNIFDKNTDKKTGFVTKNLLTVPVVRFDGQSIGVVQCLNTSNENGFLDDDLSRIEEYCGQMSMTIDNAILMQEAVTLKNYQEAIFQSLSNAIITLDKENKIKSINSKVADIFNINKKNIIGQSIDDFFPSDFEWMYQKIEESHKDNKIKHFFDIDITKNNKKFTLNVSIGALNDAEGRKIGSLILLEDITQDKRILGTMSKYLDRDVLDKVVNEDRGVLAGSISKATIMFSDIRKFTTIAEEIGPQNSVNFLNEYFDKMVDCVFSNKGILDKYIGDAIMAIYGIPYTKEDDADRAIITGVEMMKQLEEFNKYLKTKKQPTIQIGIGIHTGEVIAGNIGSRKRMEYTVIGDAANLASRLESLTKYFATPFLVSSNTKKDLTKNFNLREIDRIRVKGRSEVTIIYDVLDYKYDGDRDKQRAIIEEHTEALQCYRDREWDKAYYIFQRISQRFPEEQLYKRMLIRCEIMKNDPPSGDWDGVWTLDEK